MPNLTLPALVAAFACSIVLARSQPAFSSATAGEIPTEATVLASLKTNRVIRAATDEARHESGADDCRYTFESFRAVADAREPSVDYKLKIFCQADDAAGLVEVEGRWEGRAPHELTLAIHFAG